MNLSVKIFMHAIFRDVPTTQRAVCFNKGDVDVRNHRSSPVHQTSDVRNSHIQCALLTYDLVSRAILLHLFQ